MTRGKVTLAFIADNKKRKATYGKRKKGLLKKVEEIQTLCAVDVCAIIYGPDNVEPEVWPSKENACKLLTRFNKLSEFERKERMMNNESFIQKQSTKRSDKCLSLNKVNNESEVETFVFQFWKKRVTMDQFNMRRKGEVGWTTDRMLRDFQSRMDALKVKGGDTSGASTSGPTVE